MNGGKERVLHNNIWKRGDIMTNFKRVDNIVADLNNSVKQLQIELTKSSGNYVIVKALLKDIETELNILKDNFKVVN